MENKVFLNRQEAADIAGVDKQTISNWRKHKYFKAHSVPSRTGGEILFIHKDSFMDFLNCFGDEISDYEKIKEEFNELREEIYAQKKYLKEEMAKYKNDAMIHFFHSHFNETFNILRMLFSSRLSKRQNIVFGMFLDDYTDNEISETLNITKERVRQYLCSSLYKIHDAVIELENVKKDFDIIDYASRPDISPSIIKGILDDNNEKESELKRLKDELKKLKDVNLV